MTLIETQTIKLGVGAHNRNSMGWKQEDFQESEATLSYLLNSRLAWATEKELSQTNKQEL